MAESLGQAVLDLRTDNAAFNRGLNQAQSRTTQLTSQFRSATNMAGKYAAAIGAVAVAIGTKLVKSELDAIDRLAKLSRQLGIQIDDLQGLEQAAVETGAGVQTLHQSLQAMTRRIGEAAQGTGQAKDALEQLGIPVEELINLDPAAQFRRIAGAMQTIENPTVRNAIAADLFSRRGMALVNTLAIGEEGLQRYREQVDRLGLSLSSVDAAKVEEANDSIARAGSAIQGLIRRVTIELAPFIDAIADEIVRVTVESENMGESIVGAIESALVPIGWLADGLWTVRILVQGSIVIWQKLGAGILFVVEKVVGAWGTMLDGVATGIQFLIEQANKLPLVNIPTEKFDSFRSSVDGGVESVRLLQDVMSNLASESATELNQMLLKPLPSSLIEQKVQQIRAGAARMSAAANEGASAGGAPAAPAEGGEAPAAGGGMLFDDPLDIILMPPSLLQAKLNALSLAATTGFQQMAAQTQAPMSSLRWQFESVLTDMEAITDQSFSTQADVVSGHMGDMVNTFAGQSRAMFAVSKVAGISNALIATWQGVAQALTLPFPANIAAAAKVSALGLAQVAKIRSSTFGSGGASGGGLGGGSASVGEQGLAGNEPQVQRNLTFELRGGENAMFTSQQVRELLEQMGDELADNGGRVGRFQVVTA